MYSVFYCRRKNIKKVVQPATGPQPWKFTHSTAQSPESTGHWGESQGLGKGPKTPQRTKPSGQIGKR